MKKVKIAGCEAVELENPQTGGRVLIVGTAHVSAVSAQEVSRLILALDPPPDVVVIEMDAKRQNSILQHTLSPARALVKHAQEANSIWKVFKLAGDGRLLHHMSNCFYTPIGAVLDVTPGAEFIAATHAAEQVGAHLVLGDRPISLTYSRVMACLRRPMRELAPQDIESEELTKSPRPTTPASFLEGLVEDCDDPKDALASGERLVKAVLSGNPVDARDLVVVRNCGSKSVERLKRKTTHGLMDPDTLEGQLFAHMPQQKSQGKCLQRVVVEERDLLLARAMQRSDAKCLVGVVGLGHLPGICRVWTEACTPTNHLKAAEYFLPIPADVVPFSNAEKWGQYAAASIGVTGTFLLCRHRPSIAAGLSVFGAGLVFGVAHQYATLMRGLEDLGNVAAVVSESREASS
mmetsp:Transcript_47653/g.90953  ORF Transcript_47653/g.90953 Transcript_47653/m.90953 type:complete len:405 (-) Transcript_47653:434-1648(-)|eukprot:CAMPEP_0114232756 /NCGR_PEP_ID=MMETSP0058-20121206/4789_1 /TAXON_ID=36894 /ORGANISM="Pyramimonas parkeae, CCMP726" /LENGTH=404 /DNA_ID=CAMNT_0001344277 /DNA_START=92 /DNA_END=1306 /DNA_ORIENTATION=-